jgi:cytochrome c peroxidase
MGQSQVRDITPKLQDVIAVTKPNLSDAESWDLEDILTEYGDIFAVDSDDYRRTNRVYHHVNMGEAQSIRQPPRKLPLAK